MTCVTQILRVESMARYLTPSKIGLLALVSLYTESIVPSTATIPILSFLVSHLLPVNAASANLSELDLHRHNITHTIDDLQKATISYASGIPGRTVWDLLLQKLWKVDSFDALHIFFHSLSSLLQKTTEEQQKDAENGTDPNPNRMLLSRASPLGSFVRRAQLEFTRLPFHDGVSLWKAFVNYRTPTLQQFKKRNPAAGSNSFDSNLHAVDLELGHGLSDVVYGDVGLQSQQDIATSTADIERLLEYQVDHMQSMFT